MLLFMLLFLFLSVFAIIEVASVHGDEGVATRRLACVVWFVHIVSVQPYRGYSHNELGNGTKPSSWSSSARASNNKVQMKLAEARISQAYGSISSFHDCSIIVYTVSVRYTIIASLRGYSLLVLSISQHAHLYKMVHIKRLICNH